MNTLFKMCLAVMVSAILCSCSTNKNNGVVSNEKTQESVANDTYDKTSEKIDNSNNEYQYGPSKAVIKGTLITRMYYGPPNYGQDPVNDKKEYPYILGLDQPIKVVAKAEDKDNSTISDVKEVQVVPMNKDDIQKVDKYLNKRIKIQGTFFPRHTGHHHTEVLLQVDKIIEEK